MSKKSIKFRFSFVTAGIVSTLMLHFGVDLFSVVMASLLSFFLMWCIYDLILHITGDIIEGFTESSREGHERVLLLLNLAILGIVGICINFVIGMFLSITLYCIYWMTVFSVRLIKQKFTDFKNY